MCSANCRYGLVAMIFHYGSDNAAHKGCTPNMLSVNTLEAIFCSGALKNSETGAEASHWVIIADFDLIFKWPGM